MPDQPLVDDVLRHADELDAPVRSVVSAACRELPPDASLAEVLDRVAAAVDVLEGHHRAAETLPDSADVERACAALRSAVEGQAAAERVADALSADRIQFLETSLEFHDRHGAQPCPVCSASVLDDDWVVRARAALAAEKDAAGALRVARSAAHRSRQAVIAVVREVQAPPAGDAGLTEVAEARAAHQAFTTAPVGDDGALVEHVAAALPNLRVAYLALGRAAAAQLAPARAAQTWLRALAAF